MKVDLSRYPELRAFVEREAKARAMGKEELVVSFIDLARIEARRFIREASLTNAWDRHNQEMEG